MKKISLLAFVSILLIFNQVAAQSSDYYRSGLKFNLDKEGTQYLRFSILNQTWVRSIDLNPGTEINGELHEKNWDIGARRLRFQLLAQVSPRYLIFSQIGINNQSFTAGGAPGTGGTGGSGQGKKPGLFFHDMWNEYTLIPVTDPVSGTSNKFSLYMGAGLHSWNGLSRMTSASTSSFLAIDAPTFNWPLIEVSDQFSRQFGIYAKGNLSKLGYRFFINKPFATNLTPARLNVAVDHNNGSPAYGGYVDYRFFDQESNVLPFRAGTYAGAKKVFNIGAGFYQNSSGTQSLSDTSGTKRSHDILLSSIDVFADLPFGSAAGNMAVTAYSVFYNYDFGPSYLRTIGIMNPGTRDVNYTGPGIVEGAGNSRVAFGTGTVWYTQAGLVLPKQLSSKFRLQPFAAYAMKDMEALAQKGGYWDLGANLYLDGQHAKITAQYSLRPLYDESTLKMRDKKGEYLMQLQIFL